MGTEAKYAAIEKVYREKYSYFLIYSTFLFGNVEFAKDVVQKVFLDVLSYGGDHVIDNYEAYITAIIKTQGYKMLFKEKKRIDALSGAFFVEAVDYDHIDFEKEVSLLELSMRKLRPDYAEIIRLKYVHELEAWEIAKKLGTTKYAVEKKASRAYNTIRDFIKTGVFVNRMVGGGDKFSQLTIKVYELRTSGMPIKDVAHLLDLKETQVSERYCSYLKKIQQNGR